MEEEEKREMTLASLLEIMADYQPLLPDAVNDYYFDRAGFVCDDKRIRRVLALATQKFVTDIALDALHFGKVRQSGIQSKKPSRREVLTLDDLRAALKEYGINLNKPEYHR